MKNPILLLGIILFAIFIITNKEKLISRKDKISPVSCKSVLVMLEKRIPQHWETRCEDNHLFAHVDAINLFAKNLKIEEERKNAYRELANAYIFLAKNSPSDGLERVDLVTLTLESANLKIGGKSEGKNVVKFQTLNEKENIVNHLQLSVQTQELLKK